MGMVHAREAAAASQSTSPSLERINAQVVVVNLDDRGQRGQIRRLFTMN
jgi:hypothetical protein